MSCPRNPVGWGDRFVARHIALTGGVPDKAAYHKHWDAFVTKHPDLTPLELEMIAAYTWAALRYDWPEPKDRGAWAPTRWGNLDDTGAEAETRQEDAA